MATMPAALRTVRVVSDPPGDDAGPKREVSRAIQKFAFTLSEQFSTEAPESARPVFEVQVAGDNAITVDEFFVLARDPKSAAVPQCLLKVRLPPDAPVEDIDLAAEATYHFAAYYLYEDPTPVAKRDVNTEKYGPQSALLRLLVEMAYLRNLVRILS